MFWSDENSTVFISHPVHHSLFLYILVVVTKFIAYASGLFHSELGIWVMYSAAGRLFSSFSISKQIYRGK